MDHYKNVVMDYLQSDRAVFVNADCQFELPQQSQNHKEPEQCHCDAVAIDLRHGAVYLCETAMEDQLPALLAKLTGWTKHWDAIKANLQRECKVPADWRIHVWLFVPKAVTETLEDQLEKLRHSEGARFKVKLTILEEIQPWNTADWRRKEEAWETTRPRTLT